MTKQALAADQFDKSQLRDQVQPVEPGKRAGLATKSIKRSLLDGVITLFGRIAGRTSMQKLCFNAVRLNRAAISPVLQDRDLQFLAYCFARRANSRSQILQDLWVCFELGEARGGFFVEFGATNGLRNSNSWLLEKTYGWTGILAEPNPVWHAELAQNRAATFERRCVSARTGETVTFLSTESSDPELSAIAEFSKDDHFAAVRAAGTALAIETVSLDDLLKSNNAPAVIDYISIDTEGSELHILENFSFDYRFKLISVEQNPKTEAPLQALLESKGYVRVFPHFSQWDGWYVAQELRSEVPPAIVAPEA